LFFSYHVAFLALRGVLVHLYFFSLPIDLWVVVLEPGIAKDHTLLSKAEDGKECPFRVGLVMEDYIYHFGDLTCFIGGAVHVVHRYRTGDALGANAFHMDKVFIYEVAHSSGVQECLDGMHLAGVSGTDLDRKDDRHSTGIESVGRELFG